MSYAARWPVPKPYRGAVSWRDSACDPSSERMYHSSACAADTSLRLFTEEPVSDSRGLGIVAPQGGSRCELRLPLAGWSRTRATAKATLCSLHRVTRELASAP
eukprot:scaffold39804_cov68-Phaeocystis_antarctica.AAC.3